MASFTLRVNGETKVVSVEPNTPLLYAGRASPGSRRRGFGPGAGPAEEGLCIAYALLALLDRLDLTDRTLIVVSADHGEELLDHGFVGHASTSLGGTLYDEVMRVPLLMAGPGLPRGRV